MNYDIKLGSDKDDKSIRRLLSDNPMPGPISISYERNPNFFNSLKIQGYFNQVVVAKDNKGVLGFGTRSIQKVYFNRKLSSIGYFSNLRVDKKHRNKGVLTQGTHFLKKLDEDNKAEFYYATIVDKNKIAKKIFLSKKENFPNFYEVGKIYSYFIPLKNSKKYELNEVLKSNSKTVDDIIDFTNNYGKQKNLFPHISKEDFELNIGLNENNFYYIKEKGNIVASAFVWDQTKFKQNIVRSYTSYMHFVKPFINYFSKSLKLPDINKEFKIIYLSYIVVKNDNPEILKKLIDKIKCEYSNSTYSFLVFGLYSQDPLNQVIKNYKHFTYKSDLYLVSWKDITKQYKLIKDSKIYLDIARL